VFDDDMYFSESKYDNRSDQSVFRINCDITAVQYGRPINGRYWFVSVYSSVLPCHRPTCHSLHDCHYNLLFFL